jgi:hypothetical protein
LTFDRPTMTDTNAITINIKSACHRHHQLCSPIPIYLHHRCFLNDPV